MKDEKRKHIFITGGTTGIGLALAELYLEEGHHVGICGRDLSKIPDSFKDIYPMLHSFEVDVRDMKKLSTTIKNFSKDGLDILIANAGIGDFKKTVLPDMESSRQILDINVFGVFNTFEAGMEVMIPRKKGHLVAMASVAGMVGLPRIGAYSASKAAVLKLCESFAIDLSSVGINVTAIAPGFIETPLTKSNNHHMPFLMSAEKAAKKMKKAIERKRVLYVLPFRMRMVMLVLERMPRFLYRFFIKMFRFE